MRSYDFYRLRRWYPLLVVSVTLEALGPPVMFLGARAAARLSVHPGAALVIAWVLLTAACVYLLVSPWWRLSEETERKKREWFRSTYPGKCVRCGYDIRHCPGPRCPECGDPLPEIKAADTTTAGAAASK